MTRFAVEQGIGIMEQGTGISEQGLGTEGLGTKDQQASVPSMDFQVAPATPIASSNTEAASNHNAAQAASPDPCSLIPVPCIPGNGAPPQLESAPLAYENSSFLNSAD